MPTYRLNVDGGYLEDFIAADDNGAKNKALLVVAAEIAGGRSSAIHISQDDPSGSHQSRRVVLITTHIPFKDKPKMSDRLVQFLRDVRRTWEARDYESAGEPDLVHAMDTLDGEAERLVIDNIDCRDELEDLAHTVGGLTSLYELIDEEPKETGSSAD